MLTNIPEAKKKNGVVYAFSEEGVELPVIDITHPAFALTAPNEAETAAMIAKTMADQDKRNRLPALVRKIMMWMMSRRSVLMRELMGASGTYISGMSTYLMKLGPENLGRGYASDIDRAIAAALPCFSARLRLQDTARLLADGLVTLLASWLDKPLHFVNIAGGPCMDDLNALILLRREKTELLNNRVIKIHVLDLVKSGPTFGSRALAALQAPGAPLAGLKMEMEYIPYDWAQPQTLAEYLTGLNLKNAVVGVTSEGGLFNYGTDDEIAANLMILHARTPAETVLIGTISLPGWAGQAFQKMSGAQTIPRELADFDRLVQQAGWRVKDNRQQPMNHVVSIRKIR